MTNSVFRGRTAELKLLDKKFRQNGFVMTVLYGRRRVGKTRLINKFLQDHDCRRISFTTVEREEKELLSMMTESVLMALAPDLAGCCEKSRPFVFLFYAPLLPPFLCPADLSPEEKPDDGQITAGTPHPECNGSLPASGSSGCVSGRGIHESAEVL